MSVVSKVETTKGRIHVSFFVFFCFFTHKSHALRGLFGHFKNTHTHTHKIRTYIENWKLMHHHIFFLFFFLRLDFFRQNLKKKKKMERETMKLSIFLQPQTSAGWCCFVLFSRGGFTSSSRVDDFGGNGRNPFDHPKILISEIRRKENSGNWP